MTNVGAAVANKIEAKYPHAVGFGPAGGETLMARVVGSVERGKLWLYVRTFKTRYQPRRAWDPNRFNWTDRWQYSQRKPWRPY